MPNSLMVSDSVHDTSAADTSSLTPKTTSSIITRLHCGSIASAFYIVEALPESTISGAVRGRAMYRNCMQDSRLCLVMVVLLALLMPVQRINLYEPF